MASLATEVTTISEAAAEFGLARETFRRRFLKLGILPESSVPRCGPGKGFTHQQMDQLREALGRQTASASA